MNRADWLKEKRRLAEERMDTLWAPIYDREWGAVIAPTHERCLNKFLNMCPAQGVLSDAACGTGKYWPMILASGRTVVGVDQSRAMLARAREKHPAILTRKVGLQELDYEAAFPAAICMDAMENICPEDWPRVLANLHQALEAKGQLYFTVELADEKDVERDFVEGRRLGLPVAHGESAVEPGYHYYPRLEQVRAWLDDAQFNIVEETTGDEYQHFWVQKL